MRVARSAGTAIAASETSDQHAAHRRDRQRIARTDAVKKPRHRPRHRERDDDAERQPENHGPDALRDHQPADLRWSRAEGEANSHLARALTDRVRDHCGNPERDEREGHRRERAE